MRIKLSNVSSGSTLTLHTSCDGAWSQLFLRSFPDVKFQVLQGKSLWNVRSPRKRSGARKKTECTTWMYQNVPNWMYHNSYKRWGFRWTWYTFSYLPLTTAHRGESSLAGVAPAKSQQFHICQAEMPRTEVDQVQPRVWPNWSAPWAQRDLISSTALLRVLASFCLMKATPGLSHRTTKPYGTAEKIHGLWSLAYLGSSTDPTANHLNYWWSVTSSPGAQFPYLQNRDVTTCFSASSTVLDIQ